MRRITEDVPEGQLPRDALFWATYYAVRDEEDRAYRRGECLVDGHNMHWDSNGNGQFIDVFSRIRCDHCNADYEQILEDLESKLGCTVIREFDGAGKLICTRVTYP